MSGNPKPRPSKDTYYLSHTFLLACYAIYWDI